MKYTLTPYDNNDVSSGTPVQHLLPNFRYNILSTYIPTFCTGPFWYAPPVGHDLVADRPHEVAILDELGSLSGANEWRGLQTELDNLVTDVQREGLYTRHECSLCCKKVGVPGPDLHVRAAVCDGLTALRREKCAVYGCANGRYGIRGSRYDNVEMLLKDGPDVAR